MLKSATKPAKHKTSAPDALARISIVSPRNNERHKIIAPIIAQENSAYYSLTDNEENYITLTEHILEQLQAQGGAAARLKANASAQDAGQALAKALAKSDVETLVIDDADLLTEDPTPWIEGLLSGLPPSTHIVITARALNTTYWNPLITNGSVAVLGETSNIQMLDGTPDQLEVYALGVGAVWYEGRSVVRWDGPLTRRLFYFLLDR